MPTSPSSQPWPTLLRPKRNDKAVLLNLPVNVLEEVDMAVRQQGVTRSQFLRQAVERNLRHYQNFERAIFARIHLEGTRYGPPALGNANKPSSEAKHLYRHQEGLNPQLVGSAVWHIAVLVFVGSTRAVRLRLCLQPKLKGRPD